MNVLSIEGLTVDFNTAEGQVRAVDNVSFVVPENRTVALVGESGSGKSMTGRAILGLVRPRPRLPLLPNSGPVERANGGA